MQFLREVRERRLFQIVAAYAAAGWVVVGVVDQFIERGIFPEIAFQIALIWYVGGLVIASVVGWYHGEKGSQKVVRSELLLLGTVGIAVLVGTGWTVNRHVEAGRASEARDGGYDPRRIAVLYFEDEVSGDEGDYLGDAVTEALIQKLSAVRSLDVISRDGVSPFRRADVTWDSVASALGAGTLVDGTVEQAGDGVRINLRLVDGASGVDFRRGSVEHPMEDLQQVETRVAEEVALLLREWLGEEVELRRRTAGTEEVAAWRLLQQGERARKDAQAAVADDDARGALEAYERADSLLTLAEVADAAWHEPPTLRARMAYSEALARPSLQDRVAVIERGLAAAERALEVEPGHPEAVMARGALSYLRWLLPVIPDPNDRARVLAEARSDLERAVELDPGLAWGFALLSHLYYQVGDVPAAVLAARRAYEEDIYLESADVVLSRLFDGSLDLGQFAQAERWCQEGVRRFPEDYRFVVCRLRLMSVPGATPDPGRAWALSDSLVALAPAQRAEYEEVRAQIFVGGALAQAGLADSASAVLDRAHAAAAGVRDPGMDLHFLEAYMRSLTQQDDRAIDLLKEAVAATHGFAAQESAWWWRKLREHPRFEEVVTDH